VLGLSVGLSCGLLLGNSPKPCQQSLPIETNDSIVIDTIGVIEEDGVKWHTLDSLYYESIDTTIINYPWGREEIYYFKYKES
jgi:hypothetical protein